MYLFSKTCYHTDIQDFRLSDVSVSPVSESTHDFHVDISPIEEYCNAQMWNNL